MFPWLNALLTVVLAVAAPPVTDASWLQWGGPRRNFMVESSTLATSWPASGPKRVWERTVGEGHSAIVVDGNRLYTMYRPEGLMTMVRRARQETVAAIDAATGKPVWEYTYNSAVDDLNLSEGAGPHSTPLIVGNILYALSSRSQIFAIDKQSGNSSGRTTCTASSKRRSMTAGIRRAPIAYRDTVIVPSGGPGSSVVAFNQKTGAVAWKSGSFPVGPGSPIIINVDGQEQFVVLGANEVVGLSPADGTILWTHPHKTEWGLNISTPVWGEGNLLLVSSAYNNGTRLLKLSQTNGKTAVQELWYQNRMRVHIGTVIRLGDFAVGSSGDFGPCPTAGIESQDRQRVVAEPRVRPFDIPLRRRQADHRRRGRQPGSGDGHARRPEGICQGVPPEEPCVDRAHASRQPALHS